MCSNTITPLSTFGAGRFLSQDGIPLFSKKEVAAALLRSLAAAVFLQIGLTSANRSIAWVSGLVAQETTDPPRSKTSEMLHKKGSRFSPQ